MDDEDNVRAMLSYLFREEGYEVQEANNGAAALEALAENPPDVMLLDLRMPELGGLDVLRARQDGHLAPDTRVLILTVTDDDSQDATWCWELGADEYLTKPIDPDRLVREVTLLRNRSKEELDHHREAALADARERDRIEAAFRVRHR